MKLSEISVTNPYLELGEAFYDFTTPSPLEAPELLDANSTLAIELGIDKEELFTKEFVEIVNGSRLFKGSKPFAMAYAGHQFGHFVPRLGDGRAINIGTIGKTHLQLKGSGQTKYSRNGDGRAVLRSSIREYLISEAMYSLNIPTTRALAIIDSSHSVYREEWERGAIVLRSSSSWIRVGTFEYFAHNSRPKELEKLIEYTIAESYPHLLDESDRITLMLKEFVARSAKLIAQWMSIGFNHGVMNTDNFSIAGITIDYGPFAFLDDYDFSYICNHTDREGRYSFGNQPYIAKWNIAALFSALATQYKTIPYESILNEFDHLYHHSYHSLMMQKLGLKKSLPSDRELLQQLLSTLQQLRIDYTLFFRELSHYSGKKEPILRTSLYHNPLNEWLDIYDKRLELEELETNKRLEKMQAINPKYVLKNYMLQEAIDAAQKREYQKVKDLFTIAQNPYSEHPEFERWSQATPDFYKNRKLSCSS